MDDNTYAVRTKLRVPPRYNKQARPKSVSHSNLLEIAPESKIISVPEPGLPMALPTIPIMEYVTSKPPLVPSAKPAALSRYKPIDNIITDKSRKYIKHDSPHKALSDDAKDKISNQDSGEYDHEPATKPIHIDAAKNASKITRHRQPILKQLPLAITLFAVLGTTSYVSFDSWQANSRLIAANNAHGSVLGISTVSTVAADEPLWLYIDNIGTKAKMSTFKSDADGLVQLPSSLKDAFWYSVSAKPGQPGAAVFAGRSYANNGQSGVFGYLKNIHQNDQIIIERGDGEKLKYSVSNIEILPNSETGILGLTKPYGDAEQGINLVTNADKYDADGESNYKLIVRAVLVK